MEAWALEFIAMSSSEAFEMWTFVRLVKGSSTTNEDVLLK